MAFLTWTQAYSVGVKSFDNEHIRLMTMINGLHDSLREGSAQVAIRGVVHELIRYTITHFEHEERELKKYGYPLLAEHKEQHQVLKAQVIEFRNRLTHGFSGALAIEMAQFLKQWLITHIQDEDMQYGTFLNAQGVF